MSTAPGSTEHGNTTKVVGIAVHNPPLNLDEATTSIKILPISDLHIPVDWKAATAILENRSYLNQMDLVVLMGDQCAAFGTEQEYAEIGRFVARLGCPYTSINGNHEFYFRTPPQTQGRGNDRYEELEPDGKRLKLQRFRDFYGLDTLWQAQHNRFGSFIFLGLDDVENSKPESLSAEQWSFLQRSLMEQTDRPAFVFCHAPVLIEKRLDLVYYDVARSGCVEPPAALHQSWQQRRAPVFWMSGHVHLRPDHYLFDAYLAGSNVWQVHCPDSWGYSRWLREHIVPQRHGELYSRHLEIGLAQLKLTTFDHRSRRQLASQVIKF